MKFLFVLPILLTAAQAAQKGKYQEYAEFIEIMSKNPFFVKEFAKKREGIAPQGQGEPGFTCPDVVSNQVPTSAHAIRPGDIKVVAALGDSITAGNGADANAPQQVLIEYRGKVFSIGGDDDINSHVTLANILRVFNPNLKGQSMGQGDEGNFEVSQFNVAEPGARADDILRQAQNLVNVMREHPELVNIEEDWKLVTLFIGGNDLCAICEDNQSPERFLGLIRDGIQFLKDNLPRTIVSVLNVPRFDMLVQVQRSEFLCRLIVGQVCDCAFELSEEEHAQNSIAFQQVVETLQNGQFDTADDFTVVIQETITDTVDPPKEDDGDIDTSSFAPDCFHLSTKGHEIIARGTWNNMFQAVGQKQRDFDISIPDTPLNCPDPACPFIRTTRNSANCN